MFPYIYIIYISSHTYTVYIIYDHSTYKRVNNLARHEADKQNFEKHLWQNQNLCGFLRLRIDICII